MTIFHQIKSDTQQIKAVRLQSEINNLCAKAAKLLFEVLIATLDVNNIIHNGDSLCCQSCNNKSCPSTKIRCTYSCTSKLIHAINNCGIAFNLNTGSHSGKLVCIFEAILKNTLSYNAGSLCKCKGNRNLRLHISRISRIWKGLHMSAMKSAHCTYTYGIIKLLNFTSDFLKLGCSSFEMLWNYILNCDITTGSCCSEHKGSCLNLVRNDGILCAVKLLNTLDTDHICTSTFDIGSHAVQEVGNVNHMRLLRRIDDCRLPFCARRCQQIQKEIDEKEPLIDDENIRQAWGISFSCHGSGPSSKEGLSGAVVMLNADASVHLLVGSADIGQGSETMESQIAAECLGIPLSSVQITAADTGLTPYNTGTFGSSQTFICGNAVKLACDDLKKKMVEQLKVIYDGCTVKEKNHRYYISGGEELELSFEDAARKILFDPKGSVPIGAGTYKALACPNPFSVCFVKAEYHKKLNAIRLMDIIEVVDVGTPINRLTVAGQLEGGIAQGVGYALYERMEINPRSRRTLSTDFLHYRIPQMGDMPRTYVDMVNSHDPYGPHGAKSVGELATVPVAPAIVNAVRRASGIEINSLPLCDKFAILPTERGNVK